MINIYRYIFYNYYRCINYTNSKLSPISPNLFRMNILFNSTMLLSFLISMDLMGLLFFILRYFRIDLSITILDVIGFSILGLLEIFNYFIFSKIWRVENILTQYSDLHKNKRSVYLILTVGFTFLSIGFIFYH